LLTYESIMENSSLVLENRRPLKTRSKAWAQALAKALASSGISPNQISLFSLVFSVVALAFFVTASAHNLFLIFVLLGIQGRLLCNLMDGMVAIEFKKKSAVGELYNEIPDRLADALIILGAGYFSKSHDLAMSLTWVNILLAVLTAYIRTLGASLGNGHKFLGPMAKQHRMALLSSAVVIDLIFKTDAVYIALWIMFIGLVITIFRRIQNLAQFLKLKEKQ